jgi:hypothetical protein
MDSLRAKYKEEMKGVPQSEWNTPKNMSKWQAMYTALRDSADYKRRMAEFERLQTEFPSYIDGSAKGQRIGNDPAVAHGYVWLFRRK